MSKKTPTLAEFRREVRSAVADYMRSEGCDCCRDRTMHELNAEHLAELLRVPKYADGSGFDFPRFRTAK
jgi:hypothetical protein